MNAENIKRKFQTTYSILCCAFVLCCVFTLMKLIEYQDFNETCNNNYSQISGGGRTSKTVLMKIQTYIEDLNNCGEDYYKFTVTSLSSTGYEQSYIANSYDCYKLKDLHKIGRIGTIINISYDRHCNEVFDTVLYTKQKADDSCPHVYSSLIASCYSVCLTIILFCVIRAMMNNEHRIISWLTISQNGSYEAVTQNNVEMTNV